MRISPRVRNSAATLLAVFGGLLALLAVGPTPAASASFDGSIGSPGPYVVTPVAGHASPPMIEASAANLNTTFFATTGVTVGPSAASSNPQTVTARYRLDVWSAAGQTWVSVDEHDVSQLVGSYMPGYDTPRIVLGQHIFWEPTPRTEHRSYRVMYTITWHDNVTDEDLGYVDVYPEYANNVCAMSQCKAWSDDVEVSP
jgi:hypothetical protein